MPMNIIALLIADFLVENLHKRNLNSLFQKLFVFLDFISVASINEFFAFLPLFYVRLFFNEVEHFVVPYFLAENCSQTLDRAFQRILIKLLNYKVEIDFIVLKFAIVIIWSLLLIRHFAFLL